MIKFFISKFFTFFCLFGMHSFYTRFALTYNNSVYNYYLTEYKMVCRHCGKRKDFYTFIKR
jgi:hypothetical protein